MHPFEACQLNPKYTLFLMHSQRYAYTRQDVNFAISTPILFIFSELISCQQVARPCLFHSQKRNGGDEQQHKIVVMQQQ